tara:strand:- start:782 stop:1015 length:234 start_codon:yes stop_codon:yes gene_type:complete
MSKHSWTTPSRFEVGDLVAIQFDLYGPERTPLLFGLIAERVWDGDPGYEAYRVAAEYLNSDTEVINVAYLRKVEDES